ncbi:Lck interacting transmembrane adaptor 1 [Cricetulus griseus]
MDFLHPHWLEASRGSTRSQVTPSAFSSRQLPRAPPAAPATASSTSPEATYSNVGLAAIPRASLAASPMVWAGTQLTISCAKLGPGAEYACIQKHKETEQGYQESQQKTKMIPAPQMDLLYSRVCKPKRRDPRPVTDEPDPQGGRAILALGSDVEYEAITLRGQDVNQDPLENVYESIREKKEGDSRARESDGEDFYTELDIGSSRVMPRSAGKRMAWITGTCGAKPAAGQKPASSSWPQPILYCCLAFFPLPA